MPDHTNREDDRWQSECFTRTRSLFDRLAHEAQLRASLPAQLPDETEAIRLLHLNDDVDALSAGWRLHADDETVDFALLHDFPFVTVREGNLHPRRTGSY